MKKFFKRNTLIAIIISIFSSSFFITNLKIVKAQNIQNITTTTKIISHKKNKINLLKKSSINDSLNNKYVVSKDGFILKTNNISTYNNNIEAKASLIGKIKNTGQNIITMPNGEKNSPFVSEENLQGDDGFINIKLQGDSEIIAKIKITTIGDGSNPLKLFDISNVAENGNPFGETPLDPSSLDLTAVSLINENAFENIIINGDLTFNAKNVSNSIIAVKKNSFKGTQIMGNLTFDNSEATGNEEYKVDYIRSESGKENINGLLFFDDHTHMQDYISLSSNNIFSEDTFIKNNLILKNKNLFTNLSKKYFSRVYSAFNNVKIGGTVETKGVMLGRSCFENAYISYIDTSNLERRDDFFIPRNEFYKTNIGKIIFNINQTLDEVQFMSCNVGDRALFPQLNTDFEFGINLKGFKGQIYSKTFESAVIHNLVYDYDGTTESNSFNEGSYVSMFNNEIKNLTFDDNVTLLREDSFRNVNFTQNYINLNKISNIDSLSIVSCGGENKENPLILFMPNYIDENKIQENAFGSHSDEFSHYALILPKGTDISKLKQKLHTETGNKSVQIYALSENKPDNNKPDAAIPNIPNSPNNSNNSNSSFGNSNNFNNYYTPISSENGASLGSAYKTYTNKNYKNQIFTKTPDKTRLLIRDEIKLPRFEHKIKSFIDIPNNYWAKPYIDRLSKANILRDAKDKFNPNEVCNRSDTAVMLVRLLGLDINTSYRFDDVNYNSYIAPYISTAASYDIIRGYNGLFKPNDPISRQDLMVMIYKILESSNISINANTTVLRNFSDSDQISNYAINSVATVINSGIISGNNGKIKPNNPVTKAEMSSILCRLYDVING